MKEDANWIIIDLRTQKALYGMENKTLKFTTEEIAFEVAKQLLIVDEFTLFDLGGIK